jgi:hypothetical protein
MGRSYFYIRFDRPRGDAWEQRWEEVAAKVLPVEAMDQWRKILVKEKQDEEDKEKTKKFFGGSNLGV